MIHLEMTPPPTDRCILHETYKTYQQDVNNLQKPFPRNMIYICGWFPLKSWTTLNIMGGYLQRGFGNQGTCLDLEAFCVFLSVLSVLSTSGIQSYEFLVDLVVYHSSMFAWLGCWFFSHQPSRLPEPEARGFLGFLVVAWWGELPTDRGCGWTNPGDFNGIGGGKSSTQKLGWTNPPTRFVGWTTKWGSTWCWLFKGPACAQGRRIKASRWFAKPRALVLDVRLS